MRWRGSDAPPRSCIARAFTCFFAGVFARERKRKSSKAPSFLMLSASIWARSGGPDLRCAPQKSRRMTVLRCRPPNACVERAKSDFQAAHYATRFPSHRSRKAKKKEVAEPSRNFLNPLQPLSLALFSSILSQSLLPTARSTSRDMSSRARRRSRSTSKGSR